MALALGILIDFDPPALYTAVTIGRGRRCCLARAGADLKGVSIMSMLLRLDAAIGLCVVNAVVA